MGIQKKPEVSYNKMNRTAFILFAFFGLTMALSTKVHQKAKMIKSDRWDSCSSNWVGDGACDDECNTEDNSWDGGDCCGPDVNDWWRVDCECLDPNSEDFGAVGGQDEEDPCTFWYVGDGTVTMNATLKTMTLMEVIAV